MLNFGWGSAPDPTVGAYSALPYPWLNLMGLLLRGRGRRGDGEERGIPFWNPKYVTDRRQVAYATTVYVTLKRKHAYKQLQVCGILTYISRNTEIILAYFQFFPLFVHIISIPPTWRPRFVLSSVTSLRLVYLTAALASKRVRYNGNGMYKHVCVTTSQPCR